MARSKSLVGRLGPILVALVSALVLATSTVQVSAATKPSTANRCGDFLNVPLKIAYTKAHAEIHMEPTVFQVSKNAYGVRKLWVTGLCDNIPYALGFKIVQGRNRDFYMGFDGAIGGGHYTSWQFPKDGQLWDEGSGPANWPSHYPLTYWAAHKGTVTVVWTLYITLPHGTNLNTTYSGDRVADVVRTTVTIR